MKQMIALMALLLIQKNGQTTNLEIKNGLRDQFRTDPNFKLYQSEVAAAMDEIAVEHNLQVSYDQVGAHQFRVFTLPTPPVTDGDGSDATDDLAQASKNLLQVDQNGNLSAATPASTTATAPQGFGPQLDPTLGDVAAYWAKDTTVKIQGNDRKTIIKEMLSLLKPTTPGLKYDDIRVCSVEYFNKSVAGR